MKAIAANLTSFLAWAIALTMIAALALGGLIGWVRSRSKATDIQYEDGE